MTALGATNLDALVTTVFHLADEKRSPRLMVAIAGGPGAGKSTFAVALVTALNAIAAAPKAVYVPMDGFHKTAAVLQQEGTTALKGKPETFYVEALHAFLLRLKRGEKGISGPAYSRHSHDVVLHAYVVNDEEIAIVEGNYLLLNEPGWCEIRELFDYKMFLHVSEQTATERLRKRHLAGARSAEWTAQHLHEVDLPNYRLVATLEKYADLVVSGE